MSVGLFLQDGRVVMDIQIIYLVRKLYTNNKIVQIIFNNLFKL